GRRAHTLRIESAKACALCSEARHARRAIPFVERIDHWHSVGVRKERHRGIHHSHVIDEEDDNVGPVSCPLTASSEQGKTYKQEDTRYTI
ncbi:MAG: hypothetical protein ACJAS5_001343, partial [Lentimonas sp.]